jgi:hypothetical protein
MNVNWFSPLPPVPSRVVDYTMTLLPVLQRTTDVTVWTHQEEWCLPVGHDVRVRRFTPGDVDWRELAAADLTVYNLDDDVAVSSYVWLVSIMSPGLAVLHAQSYQRLFYPLYNEWWSDRDGYLAAMREYHGLAGYQAAVSHQAGLCQFDRLVNDFPLCALAAKGALAVIIHEDVGPCLPSERFPQVRQLAFPPVGEGQTAPGQGAVDEYAEALLATAAGIPQARNLEYASRLAGRIGESMARCFGRVTLDRLKLTVAEKLAEILP